MKRSLIGKCVTGFVAAALLMVSAAGLTVNVQAAERPALKVYVDGALTVFEPPAKVEADKSGYGTVYVPKCGLYKAVWRESAETKGKTDYIALYDAVKKLDGVSMVWLWDENVVKITTTPVKTAELATVPATSTPSAPKVTAPIASPAPTDAVVVCSDKNKPVVGDTPWHILVNPNDTAMLGSDKYTDPYSFGSIGQCAWYAKARFTEVHGIAVNIRYFGAPKNWLTPAAEYDDLLVVTDLNAVKSLSIAVYKPADGSQPGHAVFVEYVERDAAGKPLFVYTTEANGNNTLNTGKFDPGYDGAARKLSFEDFKKESGALLGYIAAK